MFGFVQSWLSPRANPIGVDFGTDALRLAQVQWTGTEHKVIAAGCVDVPSHVRGNHQARTQFFIDAVRDLLAQSNFKGRQAVLGLPAALMHIQHLRLPKMDEAELRKALPFEARGKIPIDPGLCILRHMVAGEVYADSDPKSEVIVMAAAREQVNQLLGAAGKARLDIVGMNVEPLALVDCFGHVYRRKSDDGVVNCFVDIGASGTRVLIARGTALLFARSIPIGGDTLSQAAADAVGIAFDEARLLRLKLAHQQPQLDESRERQVIQQSPDIESAFPLLGSQLRATKPTAPPAPEPATTVAGSEAPSHQRKIEQACAEPLNRLVEELELCRRYYEATFPSAPVDRLIFVGGESRNRSLCQHIARSMQLAAQVGDPMVRMARVSDIGVESGIDRRQPQPAWAVAIGLSMGAAVPAGAQGKSRG
jgi:type IV pilus assembly protein PilM